MKHRRKKAKMQKKIFRQTQIYPTTLPGRLSFSGKNFNVLAEKIGLLKFF